MAFIDTVDPKEAAPAVAKMYEQDRKSRGYIPNYSRLFSLRPEVKLAWNTLIQTIHSTMDQRRYELVTLSAARALRSSYCMLAHGSVLLDRFYTPEQLASIVQDSLPDVLTEAERVMMQFAEKVVRDATSVDQRDIDELRQHGYSDAEIFDITVTATARCFFSKTLDALGSQADEEYSSLSDTLRKALTVGRPISRSS